MKHMNILRKILLFLIVFGFSGLLFLNSFVWVGRQTIMDRKVTESWLSEGKVYDNFVGELAKTVEKEQAKKQGGVNASSEGEVDTAALARAAKSAFPPTVLQENVELVLDSAYDWLEGKNDKLVFSLDLAAEKLAFVEALGNEAVAKLSSLPVCPSGAVSEDFEAFSATCLPSGSDINALTTKLKTELSSSQDILPDTSLSADDIKVRVNGEDKTLGEAFSNAPRWYSWFKSSPLVLTALIFINGGLIVLLSRPKLKGLKKLAWLFGSVGGALMLLGGAGLVVGQQLGSRPVRFGDGSDGIAENLLGPLVVRVGSSLSKWHLIIGGVYLVLAVIFMVIYKMHKKKNPGATPEPTDVKEVEPIKEEPKEVKTPPLVQ